VHHGRANSGCHELRQCYDGASGSRQVISGSIFDPCMNARGWRRDDVNGFKPPAGGGVMMVQ
jgi:hypothetical protein